MCVIFDFELNKKTVIISKIKQFLKYDNNMRIRSNNIFRIALSGIAGLFTMFSSIIFTTTVLNFARSDISDLK